MSRAQNPPPDQQAIQSVFLRVARRNLGPVAIGLSLYYAALSAAHLYFIAGSARVPMSAIAATSAVALLALWIWCGSSQFPIRWSHVAQASMGFIVLLNSHLHLFLVPELRQTTNIALAIVGGGLILLSPYGLAAMILVGLGGWLVVAANLWLDPGVTHYAFMLLSATVLSCLAQTVRRRSLRELESTRTLLREMELRKRAEEERRKLQADLLQADKLKSLGVLAGGIAHDFNNLLAVILGNVELAKMETGPASPVQRYLQPASVASERAGELTSQMLDYAGNPSTKSQLISLSEMAAEMAALLKASISKRIRIESQLEPDLPLVEADPGQIRQVIMNLTTNAAESYGEGRGVVVLETGVAAGSPDLFRNAYRDKSTIRERYTYLRVTDDGCGMDESTKRAAFDPFYTTKTTGRGLGLASVLGIVRSHQGAIHVESESGQGTRVTVYLPESAKPAVAEEAEGLTGIGPSHGRILVVDDDDMVRGVVARILERDGFSVLPVGQGREAVRIFEQSPGEIELAIVDLTMPDMGGEEVLAKLRQIRPGLPAILCSGYSGESGGQYGHGVAFLEKPFRPNRLSRIVTELLGGATANGVPA